MTYKQREMNGLPVNLTYFMQGGGKCLFFAITKTKFSLCTRDQEESQEYILEDNHGIIYFELL
jgi:hypothetical protein